MKVEGKDMITTKQLNKMYWRGFEEGKQSSLKHNISLMKTQMKESEKINKDIEISKGGTLYGIKK